MVSVTIQTLFPFLDHESQEKKNAKFILLSLLHLTGNQEALDWLTEEEAE